MNNNIKASTKINIMGDILSKLCIISMVLGITLLILVSDKIDIPSSTISSISKEDVNKGIKIKGIVTKVINKENINILEIKDNSSSIKVVLFDSEGYIIEKNSFVEVYGKVSLYEGNLEIIAETIKKLN